MARASVQQAPADRDGFCRAGANAPQHDFPPDWEILIDTYDYFTLIGGRWSEEDFDRDGDEGVICNRLSTGP